MIFSGFREDQGMSRKCEGPCCIAHPSYLAFDAFSTSWISWGCKSQVPLLVVSCLRLGGWTMDQAGPPEGPHWSIMAFRVHPCPRRLDKDGDGIVTKQEAQEALRETDIRPEMLQRRLGDLGRPTAATKWLSI